MRRIKTVILALSLSIHAAAIAGAQTVITPTQYEEDFDFLWQRISDDYAYFDQNQTDWAKVREIYRPGVAKVETRRDFVALLESALEELSDFHTHLNTNTSTSPRLVPSGADMWAEWLSGRAMITEIRPGSAADKAGMRVGMQVISINGISVDEAVQQRLGKSLRKVDLPTRNWALRTLLAGRRNEKRTVEIFSAGKRRSIPIAELPASDGAPATALLDHRLIEKDIGYIRLNNSLGDLGLIKEFDEALVALAKTKGVILDLRDTPGGGNTTVARGIMGRFINRDMAYQKHSLPAEERKYGARRSWIELVSPRGPSTYRGIVVVLVNHWTGSMGEGLAIGMDGMKRATVVGTPMAGLLGATSGIRLPNTGIGVTFPTEKLFHINGTPRESFLPPVHVDLAMNRDGGDWIFRVGQRTVRTLMSRNAR